MKPLTEALIENAKSAIISAIELHNKPKIDYRYEIVTILVINAWELMLKAYINEYHPDVKLIKKDGRTKPFEECVKFVSSTLGKDFKVIEENLNSLYEYRNHIIHFYKDPIDAILFALLYKNILLFNNFLKKHFNYDLAEECSLFLLPIGFKPFSNPIDFLSPNSQNNYTSYSTKEFIRRLFERTKNLYEEGIDEPIFSTFQVAVINENRIKNADIIVGITKDQENAKLTVNNIISGDIQLSKDAKKKVQVEETHLYKDLYTLTFDMVVKKARNLFSDFKQNSKFYRILKGLKGNPTYHKKRYLDPIKKQGIAKDWYTPLVLEELKKYYTLKQ